MQKLWNLRSYLQLLFYNMTYLRIGCTYLSIFRTRVILAIDIFLVVLEEENIEAYSYNFIM